MMRKTQSKKIQNTGTSVINVQNTSSQKLLLAKNYLEQKLESQGYRGHVRYDQTSQGSNPVQSQRGNSSSSQRRQTLHI